MSCSKIAFDQASLFSNIKDFEKKYNIKVDQQTYLSLKEWFTRYGEMSLILTIDDACKTLCCNKAMIEKYIASGCLIPFNDNGCVKLFYPFIDSVTDRTEDSLASFKFILELMHEYYALARNVYFDHNNTIKEISICSEMVFKNDTQINDFISLLELISMTGVTNIKDAFIRYGCKIYNVVTKNGNYIALMKNEDLAYALNKIGDKFKATSDLISEQLKYRKAAIDKAEEQDKQP